MESDYEIKSAPRLLYLPNELEDREQFGPRSVFENMLSSGELSAYQAYSFLIEQ